LTLLPSKPITVVVIGPVFEACARGAAMTGDDVEWLKRG